ncbi:hypothetical protein NO559_12610 [Dasania sp. GY-MA-18]|uniref:DUF2971 domain-containing protein n=1 Tax=Dasania phycosphaerae TaxID=2950436 RepID=A0A9J6RNE7_9GAMM|nr:MULTISPECIES: hypothetical protein [Dasania]MCR8923617.1 hypothetical protein [Dasania sp. GY-MA-18]MCZ0866051.1 hypothetical protein [Dasania phycosphaerae]MCZ0869775.1 hypothetical protein [Dasania phycosphaerae]
MSKPQPSASALYKYCDIVTALKIINSQSLRWSAPHLYNNPYELNYLSDTDFTAQQLLQGLCQEALAVLFGEAEATGNNKLVSTITRWQHDSRFISEQEAEPVLKQLLLPMAQQHQATVNEYLQQWRAFAQNIRICCFASSPDNAKNWQRYADNHQGIVLQFDNQEPSLSPYHAVNYGQRPIAATSLQQQVDIAFGRRAAPQPEQLHQLLLHKPWFDEDEQELRCFDSEATTADSDDQLWYKAKPFQPQSLTNIYLGINIDSSDKKHLQKLVAKAYPQCRIYQSELVSNSYNLSFTAI